VWIILGCAVMLILYIRDILHSPAMRGDKVATEGQKRSIVQEKRITKTLKQCQDKVRQTLSSGSRWFDKSDVISEDFRVEAKTKATPSSQITLKKEWFTKIEEEAVDTHKIPILAFSFGDKEDYFVLSAEDFIDLVQRIKDLENK
jgi:hypothetical protein